MTQEGSNYEYDQKEVKWQGGTPRRPQAEPGGLCSIPGPTSNKLGDLDP